MKKSKKIALVMLAVMLMAVCFVFGASAAEPTFEDYVNAGVVDPETQTIVRVHVNGCTLYQPISVYDFASGEFVFKSHIEDYYDIVPRSAYDMKVGSNVGLPLLQSPADQYFNGWYCPNTDSIIKKHGTYNVKAEDCGKIVEIIADNQPKYTEGFFDYIVIESKAILVDVDSSISGDVVIPSTLGGYPVVEIGGWSMTSCDEITSLTIPEGVTTLGDHAVYNCNKIAEIKLPTTLRRLEESSLKDLDSLAELTFPEGLEYIGEDLITYNMRINRIDIPSTVKTIDFIAFNSCLNVEDVYIYSKDVEIGEYAFGYSELVPVDGYTAKDVALACQAYLDETDEEKKAELKAEFDKMYTYEGDPFVGQNMTIHGYYNSTAHHYALDNNIKFECLHEYGEPYSDYRSSSYQCIYCGNIYEEWYETFTEGYYIYTVVNNEAGIVGITPELEGDVVIPSTLGGYPVVAIAGAFHRNETVTSVIIPDGVRYIGDGTFEKCRKKLKKVVMPDTVTYLGTGAFMECYHLEEVVLSKNIKVIEPYTFEMCYSLKELNFPDGLERVESISMTGCASLKELIFPESVVRIEGYTMMGSSLSVEKIVIGSKAKDAGDNNDMTFSELISLKDFYVYSPDYDPADSALGYVSIAPKDIPKDEWIAMYVNAVRNSDNHQDLNEEFEKFIEHTEMFETRISDILTIHAVHDSKTEIYAKENGINFEYIHDFEGAKWTYDYENMVRYRDCMYPGCDGREIEELKKTETDNGETVAPDQDGDFNIDEILGDDFLVIEEHIKENVSGDVEVEVLKGFDITLTNQDGVHIQPDGIVKVKLPIDWSKNGTYKVYHVGENGVLTDMNAYREGSHLVFDTDHFSIYVIVFTPDETTEEEPDTPAEPDTSDCNCICHAKDIIKRFIAIIYKFVIELLGIEHICECGVAHY